MDESLSAAAPAHRSLAITATLATALLATAGYSVHQGRQVKQMAAQTAQVQASLNNTNATLDQLTAKLNELTAPKVAPEPAPKQARAHRQAVAGRSRMAEARWKKVQSQLDEQGQAIAATRQDLGNTRTELQGSIARTHDEIVVLQRKGERNYFEFTIDRTKTPQKVGDIQLVLKRTDPKRSKYTLEDSHHIGNDGWKDMLAPAG